LVDYKHGIKGDSISVKVEIVNSKSIMFSFFKNDEIIGTKRLKGKFKKDECFYTRRTFYVVPLFPILFGYGNFQKRIYRTDEELIIEITGNHGGGSVLLFMSGDEYNRIWRFKQIEN